MSGVRVATVEDAAAIASIYAPYVIETATSFEEIPPSVDEIARRIVSILETYPYLVFDDGGTVLGYAFGCQHRAKPAYRWSVETTLYVARDAHGRGIGRALYSGLLDTLQEQGFHSAFAGIVPPNDRSVGLHEAMGFTYIGTFPEIGFKHGKLQDLSWWRLSLSQCAPRLEPTPFARLASAPTFRLSKYSIPQRLRGSCD